MDARKEQGNNKRNNILLTYKGETHTLTIWANIIGVKMATVWKRYKCGYSIENILSPNKFKCGKK